MAVRSTKMAEPIRRHRFTVQDYHRMGEAGILTEDDRVELIDGEILLMTPIGSRHAACVNRLTRVLTALGDRAIVQVQGPVRLDSGSEPLPDLALLAPREDFYSEAIPGPDDALLLVEVADSSLPFDRDEKLPRYAGAGVAESWLVDLEHEVVEAHARPASGGYGEVRRFRRGDRLAPGAFPDLEVRVEDVLP